MSITRVNNSRDAERELEITARLFKDMNNVQGDELYHQLSEKYQTLARRYILELQGLNRTYMRKYNEVTK